MDSFIIRRPFDRHSHFREMQTLMSFVIKYTASQFWGSIVMPNLTTPLVIWQFAEKYLRDINQVLFNQGYDKFIPILTAYLTDKTTPDNVAEGYKKGIWKAAKLYPFGATTNSDKGVTKLQNIFPTLEIMQKIEMPLLVHAETDASRHEIDFLNRERVFTEESLTLIHKEFPELIISVEHITTKEACQFVESSPKNVVGTVTPHHIMYDHNALFHGGVPPYKPGMYFHMMNLPILKYKEDVNYIRNAIMFGSSKNKFGAGTDTAPHTRTAKRAEGSCCGVFNATHAVELYTMVFDMMEALETQKGVNIFENFMSVNNLWVYGLEASEEMIELKRVEQTIPKLIKGNIRPFKAGQKIPWKMSLVKN